MAEGAYAEVHELWVWAADEFLAANEALKSHADADVVALSQLIASGSKAVQQIRLLGVMGRAYIKIGKAGRKYIIFKGYAGLRPNLAGTRYVAENPKVACFVVGTKDIIADAAKATKIAVIAFVAIDIIAELQEDQFSLASLGVRILSDVLQAIVAAGAGAAAGVLVTTLGVPTVAAFVVVVLAGFMVGALLTEIDRRYLITETARKRMIAYENEFQARIGEAQSAVRSVGRRVGQIERLGANVVDAYYSVDRFWRTVQDFIDSGGMWVR